MAFTFRLKPHPSKTAQSRNKPSLIVATMLVKNEEDIIEETLQNAFDQGVDKIILMDNASEDKTRSIAASFPNMIIIDQPSGEYRQSEWQTQMALMALEMGAAWVVPIDGDELWKGISNLHLIDEKIKVVLASNVYNHPPTNRIKEPFKTTQMPIFKIDTYTYNGWGCGRMAFRPHPQIKIFMGQSRLEGYNGERPVLHELWVHHYPIRSYERYVKKVTQGTLALEKGNHSEGHGWHWRKAYKMLQEGTLRAEYDRQTIIL